MKPADQDAHYFSYTCWIHIINEIVQLDWVETHIVLTIGLDKQKLSA